MSLKMPIRSYSELIALDTFEKRFKYLKTSSKIGDETFGFDRYLNQLFYTSDEWRSIRDKIIVRDNGFDLGMMDHKINGIIIVHHMNPITKDDLINRTDYLLNPEYLISVSDPIHKALHYGNDGILQSQVVTTRTPNDTCPWRR